MHSIQTPQHHPVVPFPMATILPAGLLTNTFQLQTENALFAEPVSALLRGCIVGVGKEITAFLSFSVFTE